MAVLGVRWKAGPIGPGWKRVLVGGEGERGRSLSLNGVSQHVYRGFTILSSYYHIVECKVFYYYSISFKHL